MPPVRRRPEGVLIIIAPPRWVSYCWVSYAFQGACPRTSATFPLHDSKLPSSIDLGRVGGAQHNQILALLGYALLARINGLTLRLPRLATSAHAANDANDLHKSGKATVAFADLFAVEPVASRAQFQAYRPPRVGGSF